MANMIEILASIELTLCRRRIMTVTPPAGCEHRSCQ
jgi:hypothetical protein